MLIDLFSNISRSLWNSIGKVTWFSNFCDRRVSSIKIVPALKESHLKFAGLLRRHFQQCRKITGWGEIFQPRKFKVSGNLHWKWNIWKFYVRWKFFISGNIPEAKIFVGWKFSKCESIRGWKYSRRKVFMKRTFFRLNFSRSKNIRWAEIFQKRKFASSKTFRRAEIFYKQIFFEKRN